MVDLCIDVRMIYSSGIGTYLRELLVYIILEFNTALLGKKNEINDFLKQNNLTAETIEFNPKIYSINEQLKYRSYIPECKVFWSPHYNVPLIPIKAKKRLTTIHDLNHIALNASLNIIERVYAKFVMKRAIRLADSIITVSNFSASEIDKYYREREKVNLIYNGVNVENFTVKNELTENNLPENYLLYVGNVKPHKNIKGIIKSFKLYKKTYKDDLSLVIVGKKEGLLNPEDIIEDKNIFFFESVSFSELMIIYRNAKILLFLSFYEGFGLPILEAQASGIPVICSNSSSLLEVSDGSCIEVNPNSHKEIAHKINDLLIDSSLYSSFVEKGFENIKKFSWDKSADKHLQIIHNLLKI